MTGIGVLPQSSRNGFEGGLLAILPFTENFALRTGIAYVQKGLTDSLALSSGVFEIGYVELPFVFRMIALPGDDIQLHALAGFVLGFKASCSFRVDSIGVGTVYPASGSAPVCGKSLRRAAFDVNGTDNSAVFGLNLTLLPTHQVSYELAATWELGLNNVDPEVQPFESHNRVIAVTAGILYSLR
jgi:hypothetical protein